MSTDRQQRAAERVTELADRGLDLVSFWRGCAEVLAEQVPHAAAPCWYTLDPSSLLITSHVQQGLPELPAEWLEQEYLDDDVHKLADVVRSPQGISTLHEVTGGDPSTTRRWHENMRYGGDQELIAALRLPGGSVWGAVGLYREPAEPMFSDAEKGFVRRVSGDLARGARRALLYGRAIDPDGPDDRLRPGLVVLDGQGGVVSMAPGTRALLDGLPHDSADPAGLPTAVRSVAARALQPSGRDENGDPATAHLRSETRGWLTLHGAPLETDAERQVAVIVTAAHPSQVASLMLTTYDLTGRERQVVGHVLRGSKTHTIAKDLGISTHTVQEHLKHIFDKTGVRSRRDLVAMVFFADYEARVRDNERRATRSRPVLGDPLVRGPGTDHGWGGSLGPASPTR